MQCHANMLIIEIGLQSISSQKIFELETSCCKIHLALSVRQKTVTIIFEVFYMTRGKNCSQINQMRTKCSNHYIIVPAMFYSCKRAFAMICFVNQFQLPTYWHGNALGRLLIF